MRLSVYNDRWGRERLNSPATREIQVSPASTRPVGGLPVDDPEPVARPVQDKVDPTQRKLAFKLPGVERSLRSATALVRKLRGIKTGPTLNDLPEEAMLQVLGYLDTQSLLNLRAVDRKHSRIVTTVMYDRYEAEEDPHRALLPLSLQPSGRDIFHYYSEKRRLERLVADTSTRLRVSTLWRVSSFSREPENADALFLMRMSQRDGIAWCETREEQYQRQRLPQDIVIRAVKDRNEALFDLCVEQYTQALSSSKAMKVALKAGDSEWVTKLVPFRAIVMSCWLKRLAHEPLRGGEWTGSDGEDFKREATSIRSTILAKRQAAVAVYRAHLRPAPTSGFPEDA